MTYGRTSSTLRLLFSAAFLFALTACGGGTPDEEAPELTWDKQQTADPITSDITYSGTVEAEANVKLQIGENDPEDVLLSGTTWSVLVPLSSLQEGPNTISVTATDSRGNTKVIRYTVVRDIEMPTLTSPAQGATIPDRKEVRLVFNEKVTISSADGITATDPAGSVVNGKAVVDPANSTTVVWTPVSPLLPNQSYILKINLTVKDAAGNPWTADERGFATGS